jgi:hypothetical protein
MHETFIYKDPDKAIWCPNDDQLVASGGTWEPRFAFGNSRRVAP